MHAYTRSPRRSPLERPTCPILHPSQNFVPTRCKSTHLLEPVYEQEGPISDVWLLTFEAVDPVT